MATLALPHIPVKQSRSLPPTVKQSRADHHDRTQAVRPAVRLHTGRVRRGPIRSKEGKNPRTLIWRWPSDLVVSPTLPRVAPTFTHMRDTEWIVCAVSLTPLRATIRCHLLSARALGFAVEPSQRPIWRSVKQGPMPLFQLLFKREHFTLAQICQPPSVSPCARVLAYFQKKN
jgi:hypothetical protein